MTRQTQFKSKISPRIVMSESETARSLRGFLISSSTFPSGSYACSVLLLFSGWSWTSRLVWHACKIGWSVDIALLLKVIWFCNCQSNCVLLENCLCINETYSSHSKHISVNYTFATSLMKGNITLWVIMHRFIINDFSFQIYCRWIANRVTYFT